MSKDTKKPQSNCKQEEKPQSKVYTGGEKPQSKDTRKTPVLKSKGTKRKAG